MKSNYKKNIEIVDYYNLGILTIYTVLAVIFFKSIGNSMFLIIENIIIMLFVVGFIFVKSKYPDNKKILLVKRILLVPVIFLIYTQVQAYIKVINPYLYDDLIIQIDKFIFGVNPTDVLINISIPALTEYLQFSYMTYFLIPVVIGIELHRRANKIEFNYYIGLLIFSYYFSYLLYFILPAIGPRFTLYEFSHLSNELPGVFLTDFFREIINFGGGILNTAQNPALLVNRDCMPSGHTLITTINIYTAFKLKSRYKWIIFIIGCSLIFSTVYLRYHYVVDLLASFLLVPLVLWFEPRLSRAIKNTNAIKDGNE